MGLQTGNGMAWQIKHGRQGMSWHCMACTEWHGMGDRPRHGMAWEAGLGMAWQGRQAGHGMACHVAGNAGHGLARHGRQDMSCHIMVGRA